MEKEAFFGNPTGLSWQMQSSDSAAPLPELSSGYLNLTWDQTIDQSAQFESALSSLVSSPSSNPQAAAAGDSFVIRELIGRLGSICNSDEISPPSSHYQSANNSCYSTPLNSPPKLNLSMVANPAAAGAHMPFSADPGFSERAARYSSFGGSGGRSYGGGLFMLPEAGKLSRVSSSQSLKAAAGQLSNRMSVSNNGELVIAEESSASGNAKKRKAVSKGKGKEAPLSSSITAANNLPKTVEEDFNAKRSKPSEAVEAEKDSNKPNAEQDGDGASKTQEKEKSTKPLEPSKDYIHVRARRGQATDSHSLAERVRREKISERMKFLQDLVPGCNKVTGKAVMLDEIINYVQSLQRQVEFLSMKLATVNPQLEFNMDNFVPKDIHQTCGPLPPQPVYPLEATSRAFSITNPPQGSSLIGNGLELQCQLNLSRNHSMQLPPLEGLADVSSQLGTFWDDDLHTVVQMGFSQNQENIFSSQSFQGSMTTNHMKIEL